MSKLLALLGKGEAIKTPEKKIQLSDKVALNKIKTTALVQSILSGMLQTGGVQV